MARDGLLPGFFLDREQNHGSPVPSIVLQSLWVTVLVHSGSFEQSVITAFTALTVGAVTILRQRRPQLVCPYRVPFYPVLPVCYVLVAGVIMVFLGVEKPVETFWACLTLSAGIPLYFLMKKHIGTPGGT